MVTSNVLVLWAPGWTTSENESFPLLFIFPHSVFPLIERELDGAYALCHMKEPTEHVRTVQLFQGPVAI